MSEELKQTVHLIRRGKVTTDDRGRTVWEGPVEEAEFELISTQMMERLINSGDEERRRRLEKVANEGDGVLARNTANNEFEVIADDDLEKALASADAESGPARADHSAETVATSTGDTDQLSLVSTQMLRVMLGGDEEEASGDDADAAFKPESGFDPYNSG